MRLHDLAPALLLAVAACTVETDSLKPKTEAQCAAEGKKVCGYKCMDITPANGCGNEGCQACPAVPAGHEAICDAQTPSQCASRPPCTSGSAYCDGPTDMVCDDLVTSTANCGACGHYCGGAVCTAMQCAPTTVRPAGAGIPLDIAYDGTSLYWVVNDVPSPGRVSLYRSGAHVVDWAGAAMRVEADAYGAVMWSTRTGDPILEWRTGDVVPTLLFTPTSAPRSMALDPGYAYFSEVGSTATHESAVDLIEIRREPNALPGSFFYKTFTGDVGLGAVALESPGSSASRAIVGTDSGALRWVSYDLATSGTYASAVEAPLALAVYNGVVGGGTTIQSIAFWLGASGNLYAKILPGGPVVPLVTWRIPSTAGAAGLDLHADAGGVYWVDAGFQGANVNSAYSGTYGIVGEWRAAYDDTIILHLSQTDRPIRVTADADQVVWLDGPTGGVYGVAK
jgi:hypothetical protein